MKSKILFLLCAYLAFTLIGCSDDDNNPVSNKSSEIFVSLSSPYLICASRNPGGVGFDFEYNDKAGGANNMDSLTVSDFDFDIKNNYN